MIPQETAPRRVAGSFTSDRIARWFLIVIAVGLAWRAERFCLHFEITGDESGILRSVIERGYGGLLQPLSYANVSPPLFLWMTKFIDSVFRSEWAVRLPPFLAGLGAVAVFGLICRETLQGTARWMSWAVFCVSYVPITEGMRVKGYTIDLLVAALMLWWTLRWLLDGRKVRYLVWLAACGTVFVWLSYTGVFVIGAACLVIAGCLVKAGWPSGGLEKSEGPGWPNVVAALAFVALAGASAIVLYEVNVRAGIEASVSNGLANGWKTGYPPTDWWKIPMWLLSAHTGRGFAWPAGDNNFGSTIPFALWLTGLAIYWRHGNRWVWALCVAPHVLALGAAFLHLYPYLQNPRLCMYLGPGICLFLGEGAAFLIDRLQEETRRRCYGAVAIGLVAVAVAGMGREVALRIREIRGPGIRSTLGEVSRRIGDKGCFAVLNDGRVSGVSTYYLDRTVTQKVWTGGEVPKAVEPGTRMALTVVANKNVSADSEALFRDFERRLGRRLKVEWSQTAHEVLLDTQDSVAVWVCE